MGHLLVTIFIDPSGVNWSAMGIQGNVGDPRECVIKTDEIRRLETTDDPNIQRIVYYDEFGLEPDLVKGTLKEVADAMALAEGEKSAFANIKRVTSRTNKKQDNHG